MVRRVGSPAISAMTFEIGRDEQAGGRGKLPAPELVIFDCDGVLVDSEPISIGVLVDVVQEAGYRISPEEAYARFLGKSMASICNMLADDPGLDFTKTHLDRMRALLYRRFRSELRPVDGVAETLGRLLPARCVASSSQPERIALSLDVTGLLPLLRPHLFSATMVENGKPAPDLFLHAARQMHTQPEYCLVIEDSPAGIEAARRAGMRVFAFVGASHAQRPSFRAQIATLEPDMIFDNMLSLPELLGATRA